VIHPVPESSGPNRTVTAVLVALVVASVVLPGVFTGQAAAARTTIELDAARDDQTAQSSLSFTFRADANATTNAPERLTSDGGAVTFEFDDWEAVGGSADGSDSSWRVTAGTTYRVEYTVTASSGAAERTHSVDVGIDSTAGTLAREPLRARVVYREPSFGSVGTATGEVIFEDETSASGSVDVPIENTGQGLMKIDEVEFRDVPGGFDVEADDVPDEIDARSEDSFEVDADVDSDVAAGTYGFDAIVRDSLGNSQRVRVEFQVRRPPIASVDDDTVGFDGILVGTSKTTTVTVRETGDNEGIDGLDVSIVDAEPDGSIDVTAASSVSTSAGGSDQFELTISADDSAPQSTTLEWSVRLRPRAEGAPSTTVDIEANVLYPAELGRVDPPDAELLFDEPRSEVSSHATTVDVDVPNDGDLDMTVRSVTVDVPRSGISADVVDAPGTVDGTSEEAAEVQLSADPSVPEGTYEYTVTVDAGDAGERTETRELTVEHDVRLSVDRETVEYGELAVSTKRTASITVAETLGYEPIRDVTVRRTAGPGQYLRVRERPPSTLQPGEEAPLVFAVQFNTSAELYRTYEWSYEVSGEDVDARTVTVQARPKVGTLEDVIESLRDRSDGGDWQRPVASRMATSLQRLEDRIRNDEEVASGDLARGAAAGRSTLLFIESVRAARQARGTNGSAAAQASVVRAAAAHRAMETYVSRLSTPRVSGPANAAVEAAEPVVDAEVEKQTEHYRAQFESGNATALQRAAAARRLAGLASLRGRNDRAKSLRSESQAAFDRYLTLVRNGSETEQRARELEDSINESAILVAAGRAIVLNPLRISPLEDRIDRIEARYTDAARQFERAGVERQAAEVRAAQRQAATRLQQSIYVLYGWTALLGIGFVAAVVWLIGRSVTYARDVDTTRIGQAVEPA
jgi:hypothetical protein